MKISGIVSTISTVCLFLIRAKPGVIKQYTLVPTLSNAFQNGENNKWFKSSELFPVFNLLLTWTDCEKDYNLVFLFSFLETMFF